MFRKSKVKKAALAAPAAASPKSEKAAAWSDTASTVGGSSPTDHQVPTNQRGHLAVEGARDGMWLSLEERALVIKQNVVFYAPQVESSTENDSVTSFQAQMAMSLTTPKNQILNIFCDYCFARGYQCEPEGAGVRALKVKYEVVRTFTLKLGLNERQERVCIITFSIDEDATPDTSDGVANTNDDEDDEDDDDDDDDDENKNEAADRAPKQKQKHAKAKRKDSETQSLGAAFFGAQANTIVGGGGGDNDKPDAHASISSKQSLSNRSAASLARVQQMFGGGSGYFETFVTGVAQKYAALYCFRKQQALKMLSHLPQ
jgi:hypothetical protein